MSLLSSTEYGLYTVLPKSSYKSGAKSSGLLHAFVWERAGEQGKQVGSMNEESQVRGCYNITFNYTSQETV